MTYTGLLLALQHDRASRRRITLNARANTVADTHGNWLNEALCSSLDTYENGEQDAGRSYISLSIISIVQTCFDSLTDAVQTHETRRLMLQNYQVATKLLRSAFTSDHIDRSLAAPISALALYEVRHGLTLLVSVPN